MNAADPVLCVAFQGTDLVLMARNRINVSGVATYIQQSHIASVTYEVFEGGVSQGTGVLNVASVVYNTLQTGSIWTKDKKGYNFSMVLPRSFIPLQFKDYYVPVKFTTVVAGYVFYNQFKIKTKSVSGV